MESSGYFCHELGELYELCNRKLEIGSQLYECCSHFLLYKRYQRLQRDVQQGRQFLLLLYVLFFCIFSIYLCLSVIVAVSGEDYL